MIEIVLFSLGSLVTFKFFQNNYSLKNKDKAEVNSPVHGNINYYAAAFENSFAPPPDNFNVDDPALADIYVELNRRVAYGKAKTKLIEPPCARFDSFKDARRKILPGSFYN